MKIISWRRHDEILEVLSDGTIIGNIRADHVRLRRSAFVLGGATCQSLTMDPDVSTSGKLNVHKETPSKLRVEGVRRMGFRKYKVIAKMERGKADQVEAEASKLKVAGGKMGPRTVSITSGMAATGRYRKRGKADII